MTKKKKTTTSEEAENHGRGRHRPMSIDFSNVDALPTMAEVEKQYVLRVLDVCQGSKIRTYRILGVDRKTLYRKLVVWGETWRLTPRKKIDRTPATARDESDDRRESVQPKTEIHERDADAAQKKSATNAFDMSRYIHS